MRKDMKRLIIDTGRIRETWSAPRARQRALERRDPDALPETGGERLRLRGGDKGFGDRVQPLVRWLERQVGRPWNAVWSEICATNDARSIDGWHLRQHVELAVELPATRWLWFRRSFYVDERGFLRQRRRQEERRSRWQSVPDPDRIEVDDALRYEHEEGAWYAVQLDARRELSLWDPATRRRVRMALAPDDPRRWRKRRLSARDVARLGLDEERARRLRLRAE